MINTTNYLTSINSPEDLRKLKSKDEFVTLASEIRQFLVETLSQIEHAHFSSNMGVVELTIALHYVFQTPDDALIWDIGHQGYVHKILTGRKNQIARIRTSGGISGFLSTKESEFDVFGAGHAGTSISAALGMAIASKLQGSNRHHIAVIGDASLAAGMAFEALNHLADFKDLNLTIIINDNNCSIDSSVGGLRSHLNQLTHQSVDHASIFETLGIRYSGPINGHDFVELLSTFEKCKTQGGMKVVHCITQKGKGYEPAELGSAAHWHAPGKFDKETGGSLKTATLRYQDVLAHTLLDLAEQNSKIVTISAGMLSGTSLNQFQARFPDRCFDVGIAEQHAVTLSAGFARSGLLPFCAIYSTFIQRALDQVIHDVALQNLAVVFCVDRAGLVGHDGATHQGVFDMSFLREIPNLLIASPSNSSQLRNLIYSAQQELKQPLVIRYPRGQASPLDPNESYKIMTFGKGKLIQEGTQIMILGIGTLVNILPEVTDLLNNKGLNAGYCDMIFVKPLDTELLHEMLQSYKYIVTVEEHALIGGFGSAVAEFMLDNNYQNSLLRLGIPDEFIEHASQSEQRESLRLDATGITNSIYDWIGSR